MRKLFITFALGMALAGLGVVINSNYKVEVFDNHIADNQNANIIIASYFSTNYYNTRGVADDYSPYPQGIFVYGNRLKTRAGRARYALRKQTVEPVFGIINSVMGFRQFLLRGLATEPRMDAGLLGVELQTHGRAGPEIRPDSLKKGKSARLNNNSR